YEPQKETKERCPLCGIVLNENGVCPKCGYKK
ncbi:MAG: rubredoxin, partial [Clostridia bacterium]|nr:rubredoxin [Clostridia bacterium]